LSLFLLSPRRRRVGERSRSAHDGYLTHCVGRIPAAGLGKSIRCWCRRPT
jgi:hypothetical protein